MPQPRKYDTAAQRQAAYRARAEAERAAALAARGLPCLPSVATLPGTVRWNAALGEASRLLTLVAREMEEYFEARSLCWQEGDRGEAHQERLSAVEEILSALSDLEC